MIAICHIPVIHKGYLDFVRTCETNVVSALYLVDLEWLRPFEEFDYLVRKNSLHALTAIEIKAALEQYTGIPVVILSDENLATVVDSTDSILMPKEDISTFLAEKYLAGRDIQYENVFLRWNRENLGETKEPDVKASDLPEFVTTVFHQVLEEATKSADWWRSVGAAAVKDGKLVALAHNEHMPHEQLPNIFSDSRSLFKKGININYVTTAHAEIGVIAQMAHQGISPEGAELFVTDFPCPYCARLIAKAGIKKIYFLKGYAVLEGDEFLKGEGVELIQVGL
ncbi:MAG: deaminase [Candidatus Pacebacteria bacterium]|jgi:dCMP deaminase|nr:deaminase [Candidatus Paceibacterota bacterium]